MDLGPTSSFTDHYSCKEPFQNSQLSDNGPFFCIAASSFFSWTAGSGTPERAAPKTWAGTIRTSAPSGKGRVRFHGVGFHCISKICADFERPEARAKFARRDTHGDAHLDAAFCFPRDIALEQNPCMDAPVRARVF